MHNYLFLFTIGPVQSFIAQARKTQDLWAGSQLLSNLISKAIELIRKLKEQELTVIFPDEKTESKPNRFIVEIKMKDDNAMEELGNYFEKAIKDEFYKISKDIFNKECKDKRMPQNFDNQIKNFLEVYWAALPLNRDYNEVYADIERLLASVKNVKVFNQLAEDKRKCSLCGERNSLFYIGKKSAWFTQNDAIKIYNGNSGEGLCAVCFLKRYYKKNQNFLSTADIALLNSFMPIVNKMKPDERESIINLKNSNAQIIFEEKITDKTLEKFSIRDFKADIVKELIKIFKQKAKEKKIKISKYYALLMFDGDKMGEWLSGKNLSDQSNLKKFHRTFSSRLGEYAIWAKRFVDGNDDNIQKGKAVYAGGDDFLGFINLQYLWLVLRKLREEFDIRVNKPLKDKFQLKKDITFSAGIVISHFKTPLHFVLQKVRQMEHIAKENGGRDAFAMAVLKHSGEILETYLKWDSARSNNINRINRVLNELQNKNFSPTYLKSIQKEFSLIDINKHKNEFDSELNRLIGRSCNLSNKDTKKEAIKNLHNTLTDICVSCDYKKDAVFNLFSIIEFLKRETSIVEDFKNEN